MQLHSILVFPILVCSTRVFLSRPVHTVWYISGAGAGITMGATSKLTVDLFMLVPQTLPARIIEVM